ncbi:hypothetical protein AB5I41_10745 [Sphingomonas sp. MMS24-JH45]
MLILCRSEGALLERLADKTVAIIGTGATAVQAAPAPRGGGAAALRRAAYPFLVDVRDNGPIDFDWFSEVAVPGWQARWSRTSPTIRLVATRRKTG